MTERQQQEWTPPTSEELDFSEGKRPMTFKELFERQIEGVLHHGYRPQMPRGRISIAAREEWQSRVWNLWVSQQGLENENLKPGSERHSNPNLSPQTRHVSLDFNVVLPSDLPER